MQIGKININPQSGGTFSVAIDGYQVIKAPKEMAAEFIGMCRSMGFVNDIDAASAIEFLTKPAEQDIAELVNTGFLALIATLNMVHDGVDPDDLDELGTYDGRYESAANIIEALTGNMHRLSNMLRTMHENEQDDVELPQSKFGPTKPVEPPPKFGPECLCRSNDASCGRPGCHGYVPKGRTVKRG